MRISSRRPVRPLFCCPEEARMRAFVVAGSPVARSPVGIAPQEGDFVVAADLGAQHALAWGWPVHLLVGDLDSLPAEVVVRLQLAGVETQRVPTAKDQTDTELALALALEHRPAQIVVCGALGGRVDHLLANVLLLAHPSLAGLVVRMADGPETVRLIGEGAAPAALSIEGARDDLVSLLPFGANVEGVWTAGLRYPLRGETLHLGAARGVSNVMSDDRAEVSLTRGRLLVTHYRMGLS
jgi:thiamine pyrophosphokinase